LDIVEESCKKKLQIFANQDLQCLQNLEKKNFVLIFIHNKEHQNDSSNEIYNNSNSMFFSNKQSDVGYPSANYLEYYNYNLNNPQIRDDENPNYFDASNLYPYEKKPEN